MTTSVLDRFPAYARAVLMLIVAAVPAVMLPTTLDVFNLAKLTFLWIFGLTVLWLWLVWSFARGLWLPRFKLGYAGAAFLAAYAVASAFSQNPRVSFLGVYRRYGGLVPTLLYAAIALAMVGLYWQRPKDLRAVAYSVAAGTVPVSIYTLMQAAGLDWIQWGLPGGRLPDFPGSTLGNSNFAGGYLGIAAPFLLYLVFSAGHRLLRGLGAALLAADLAALWFSGSRGGMMAVAGGFIAVALVRRDRLSKWTKVALAGAVVSGFLVVMLVVWRSGGPELPPASGPPSVFRTDTLLLRSQYWGAAWRIFLDHPLIGTGPDTFSEIYGSYRLPRVGEGLQLEVPDKPHNIFLEYASSSGALGLGTYAAMIGLGLAYGFRRPPEGGDHEALLAAFTGGLVAYCIQGFFSMDLPAQGLMGWVSLGGIAVLADPLLVRKRASAEATAPQKDRINRAGEPQKGSKGASQNPAPSAAASLSGARIAGTTLSAIAVLGLMAAGMRPLLADIEARSAVREPRLSHGLERLSKADRLFSWGSTYQTIAVRHVVRRAGRSSPGTEAQTFQQAHRWLLETRRREPRSTFVAMNLARLNAAWAEQHDPERFPVADRWWRNALKLNSGDWSLLFNYGAFLGNWALKTEDPAIGARTVSVMQDVSRLRPKNAEVWVALGKSYILTGEPARAHAAFKKAIQVTPGNPSALRWLAILERGRRND